MSQGKKLLKNTFILSLGMLSSKFLTFLLLPLYTNKLATTDYGMVDVLISIVGMIVPIISLQLGNGVFRYLIQAKDEADQKKIVTSCFAVEAAGLILATAVIFLVDLVFDVPYKNMFIAYLVMYVINDYVLNIARGLGKNGFYAFASALSTLVSLLTNLVLILRLDFGGEAILISSILSFVVADLFLLIGLKAYRYIGFKSFSTSTLKEVLGFSVALVPNSISWWITNASDRLIIAKFLGTGANGIYAVAYKFPSIFTTIFHVFELSWSEAVSRNIDEGKADNFIKDAMKTSTAFTTFLLITVTSAVGVFFELLIGAAYASAYLHCLILLISSYFAALCSLYGGIFTGYKKSWIIAKTTIIGAIVNLGVHFALVNFIGLYAASISTLVSYMVVFVVRGIMVQKFIRIGFFSKTTILLCIVYLFILLFYILHCGWGMILFAIAACALLGLSYKNEIQKIYKKVLKKK